MTRHFDYLTKDDAGDFFQKVALDESGVRANQRPPAMTKTAAPVAVVLAPFEKIAARLDRDIEFLKTAGPCGLNAGMQKRANAYIDVVLANADLSLDQVGEIFDKVASAAIQADVIVAYEQLCEGLPEHEYQVVDDVLIKLGGELVELALLEKEAFNLGSLGRIGRGAKEIEGLSHAAKTVSIGAKAAPEIGGLAKVRAGLSGAKEVAMGPVRAAKQNWNRMKEVGVAENASRMNAARAARTAKIQGAPARLEGALAKSRAAEKMKGVAGTAAKGSSKSLEKQLGQANAAATADAARGAKLPARPHAPKGDVEAAPAARAKDTAAKTDGDRQRGAAKADDAAKPGAKSDAGAPPKDPPKDDDMELGPAGGKGTPSPPGGADGKPPGFMDAWKKVTEGGWKGLSPAEKGVLIRGGVTAAIATRAVTGHGAITGGEGLI